MRKETRNIYTAVELKKMKDQTAFDKAFKDYLQMQEKDGADPFNEIGDSFEAVFEAAGMDRIEYNIGYPGSFVRFRFPVLCDDNGNEIGEAGGLSGEGARAWLENNLYKPLRVPDISLAEARKAEAERAAFFKARQKLNTPEERKALADPQPYLKRKTARLYHKPGELPDCPLTGVCYDDMFIDALNTSIASGDTLEAAFQSLAHVYNKLIQDEDKNQRTEEYFMETAEANDYEYDKNGERI